jgi:hypothetical protein
VATSSASRPRVVKRTSTRKLTGGIAALAAAASLMLGAGLSLEMSRGADPALWAKGGSASAQRVGPRRIVKTVVVRRVIASDTSGSAAPSATAGSTAPTVAPAPVTSSTS